MSGSKSRKRRRKTMRQQNKEEVRWYTSYFSDGTKLTDSELYILHNTSESGK
ncbi:MAG: hypothetical protein ACTSU3_02930 [Candidatus Thorarchaeota archaeon]